MSPIIKKVCYGEFLVNNFVNFGQLQNYFKFVIMAHKQTSDKEFADC